jgi:hypothetical protein
MKLQPYDVVAWTYKAEIYSDNEIIELLISEGRLSPGARSILDTDEPVSDMIDLVANVECLSDMEMADSDTQPQPVFRDQLNNN